MCRVEVVRDRELVDLTETDELKSRPIKVGCSDFYLSYHTTESQLSFMTVERKRREQTGCSAWPLPDALKEETNCTNI